MSSTRLCATTTSRHTFSTASAVSSTPSRAPLRRRFKLPLRCARGRGTAQRVIWVEAERVLTEGRGGGGGGGLEGWLPRALTSPVRAPCSTCCVSLPTFPPPTFPPAHLFAARASALRAQQARVSERPSSPLPRSRRTPRILRRTLPTIPTLSVARPTSPNLV